MRLFLLAVLAALLTVVGCKNIDDLDGIEVVGADGEFAIPLFTADFTLQKLLDNFGELAEITIEPDGGIRLTYEGEVLRETSEIITAAINDVLPLGVPVPILDNEFEVPFSIPEEYEFDFIRLKSGGLIYAFNILPGDDIDLTLTFPNILKDGEPIVFNVSAETSQGLQYGNLEMPEDLAGAVINPEEDGTLRILYTATDADGNDVQFNTDNRNLIFTINEDLRFDYLEGYLGEEVFDSTPGEIVIDFFDDFIRGDVYFQDPTITMTIENSFGLPVASTSEYFEVITINGDTLPLQSDELGEDLRINFAYPTLDEVGETKTTTYIFNRDNSNIDEILGSGPRIIRYDVDALPNPNQDTDLRGFISCESEYAVKVKADLPIFGTADNFGATDTFALDFAGYDDVASAEFKIVSENELPLDMTMQIYFAGENNRVIDSLFTDATTLIASPAVDDDGISVGSREEEFLVPVDADRFRAIADEANKVLVTTFFSTTDDGSIPVRVLADQEVQIRMGMKLRRN